MPVYQGKYRYIADELANLSLIEVDPAKYGYKVMNEMDKKGLWQTDNIQEGISDVDILYVTRIQEERFESAEEANKYKGLMSLNEKIYTKLNNHISLYF